MKYIASFLFSLFFVFSYAIEPETQHYYIPIQGSDEPALFMASHPSRPSLFDVYDITSDSAGKCFYINGEPVSKGELRSLGFLLEELDDEERYELRQPELQWNGDVAALKSFFIKHMGISNPDDYPDLTVPGRVILSALEQGSLGNTEWVPVDAWFYVDGFYYTALSQKPRMIVDIDKTFSEASELVSDQIATEGTLSAAVIEAINREFQPGAPELVLWDSHYKQSVAEAAAEITSIYAQGYIAVVQIIALPGQASLGLDLVVSVADLLDGEYLSATLGLLPYAGDAVGAGKLSLSIAGEALEVSPAAMVRIRKIKNLYINTQIGFLERVQKLAPAYLSCGKSKGIFASVFCFSPDTLVSTPNGKVRIDELTEGVLVVAFNEATGSYDVEKVEKIYQSVASSLLNFECGSPGGEVISCTTDHPLYIERNGVVQWAKAQDIEIGDKFVTRHNDTIPIVNISQTHGEFPVFNLGLAREHTYLVGNSEVIAHNNCYLEDLKAFKAAFENATAYDYFDPRWMPDDMPFAERKAYLSCFLEPPPSGMRIRVNPCKAAVRESLFKPKKVHEWIKRSFIQEIILESKDEASMAVMVRLMERLKTKNKNLIFNNVEQIGKAADGKLFGHVGAKFDFNGTLAKVDLGKSAEFHADIEAVLTKHWNDYVNGTKSSVDITALVKELETDVVLKYTTGDVAASILDDFKSGISSLQDWIHSELPGSAYDTDLMQSLGY